MPILPNKGAALYFQSEARALHWLRDLCCRVKTQLLLLQTVPREGRKHCCSQSAIKSAAAAVHRAYKGGRSPFSALGISDEASAFLGRAHLLVVKAQNIAGRGAATDIQSPRNLECWAFLADVLSSDLAQSAATADAAEVAKRSRTWKEWISVQHDPACRRAHRWTKAADSWKLPKAEQRHQRLIVPTEQMTADSEADKWGELWNEVAGANEEACLGSPCRPRFLPRPSVITADLIHTAALSFPVGTSNPDGLHPRHFSLITEKNCHCHS